MGILFSLVAIPFLALSAPGATEEAYQQGNSTTGEEDLKSFMEKVLRKRSVNWNDQYNYIFSERETLEFGGTFSAAPLQGFTSEFVWYVKEGYLVRSPVSVNGAPVPDDEREREEKKFIKSLEKGRKSGEGVDRDKFFGFDFKKGEFVYAGTQEYESREVVVIEFYPEGMFNEGTDDDDDDLDKRIERGLEKSMTATLLIIPEEHQIVRMTLNNLDFGFLPGKWMVRIGEIGGVMKMAKQYGEVWLSEEIAIVGQATTAYGDLYVRYTRRFYDYKEAEVKVKFRFEPRKEGK